MKLKLTLTLFLNLTILSFSQTLNPFYQNLVSQVKSQNTMSYLTEFVSFGEKRIGSTAEYYTRNWLIAQYENWGYTHVETQNVYASGQVGQNIIVTKTGTTFPDEFIVVTGHYDTIFGPGANDNGSGTAVILEMARILQNIPTEYSIKFIHFTAEELGLIGSKQYVENIVVPQNLNIKLVLNIDQVGGVANQVNNTITCEKDVEWPTSNDDESATATSQLATSMELYSNLQTHISHAYGSDYVPFQEKGFVITGLYEFNESPYPHSPQDTLENMDPDFVYQVTKGALGALCFFAKAYEEMSTNELQNKAITVYPNPTSQFVNVKLPQAESMEFKIIDLDGKLHLQGIISNKNHKINLKNLKSGVYILNLNNQNQSFSQKIIIN